MRRALMVMSDCAFLSILQGFIGTYERAFEVVNPLPRDVKIIRAYHSDATNTITLLLENEEFRKVKNGELYPTLDPIQVRVNKVGPCTS